MAEEPDVLRPLVQLAVQEFLEAEMDEALGAGQGERCAGRLGYRSGYYPRKLVTRVGTLELRVPQDRQGRFSTEIFARYQRSEKALVAALVEMYVQGVSTRKVKAVSEELCGHEFSAGTISELNATLDAELERFARQPLEAEYPYLILDARYEKVREDGVIRSRAVLVAIGIDWEGRRRILGVELAGVPARPQAARTPRRPPGHQRRSPGPPAGRRRDPAGGGLAALLRPLPAQRPGPPPAQGQR